MVALPSVARRLQLTPGVMWTEVEMGGCQLVPVLSAALTPAIAILAATIAYQQWRTNHNKLRLDLYDRRFTLYSALADLCISVASSGRADVTPLDRFLEARHKTQFLFDSRVAEYLETVRKKAYRMRYLHDRLDGSSALPVGDDRTKAAEEHSDLMKWFGDQYVESRSFLGRYLVFE